MNLYAHIQCSLRFVVRIATTRSSVAVSMDYSIVRDLRIAVSDIVIGLSLLNHIIFHLHRVGPTMYEYQTYVPAGYDANILLEQYYEYQRQVSCREFCQTRETCLREILRNFVSTLHRTGRIPTSRDPTAVATTTIIRTSRFIRRDTVRVLSTQI